MVNTNAHYYRHTYHSVTTVILLVHIMVTEHGLTILELKFLNSCFFIAVKELFPFPHTTDFSETLHLPSLGGLMGPFWLVF